MHRLHRTPALHSLFWEMTQRASQTRKISESLLLKKEGGREEGRERERKRERQRERERERERERKLGAGRQRLRPAIFS
jgi:hypothetical protein